ncbi:MAG: glycosyltransferase [Candidatus Bathyarchaeia archaeon]
MPIRIFWCQPVGVMDYRLPFFEKAQRAFDITFLFHQRGPVNHKLNCTYSSSISRIIDNALLIKMIGLSVLGPADFQSMYSSIQRCNVFVSSFVWNSYTLVGLVLCKLFRKKVIVWEEMHVVPPGLRFGIQHALIRMALKHIDAFFVCGESQNHFLISNGVAPKKLFVTNEYPGHVYSDVQPRPVALPFNAHEKVILYLGRLVEAKGVEYLIKAFSLVEKQCNDATLVIVGDGPLRKDLENLARQLGLRRIHFTGYVGDVHVKSYLFGRSCMVIVPSIITEKPKEGGSREAGSMVALEALSAGKPVISTDAVPHCLAFIKDGINGYRVPQRNVDALADKIMRLLDVPIMPTQVLSTFREIKGHDYQVEQLQEAVSYVIREKTNT